MDVAWIAALELSSQDQPNTEPFQAISCGELIKQQREDPVIRRVLELKENHALLTEAHIGKLNTNKKTLKRMEQVTNRGPHRDTHG